MTEQEAFLGRFGEMRGASLEDIKFFVAAHEDVSSEVIFADLNRIEAARENGECEIHTAWVDGSVRRPVQELIY